MNQSESRSCLSKLLCKTARGIHFSTMHFSSDIYFVANRNAAKVFLAIYDLNSGVFRAAPLDWSRDQNRHFQHKSFESETFSLNLFFSDVGSRFECATVLEWMQERQQRFIEFSTSIKHSIDCTWQFYERFCIRFRAPEPRGAKERARARAFFSPVPIETAITLTGAGTRTRNETTQFQTFGFHAEREIITDAARGTRLCPSKASALRTLHEN